MANAPLIAADPGAAALPAQAPRLDALFAAQAAATPEAEALLWRGTTLRYRDLDAWANRVAHRLRARGVGPGTLVGLCLERSPEMIATLLGILKAGGAYLPLDPAYPADWLDFVLADSGAPLLASRAPLVAGLGYAGRVIDLDAEAEAIAAAPDSPPEPAGTAADTAYVIYTSGSTGRPKGVMLAHTARNLVDWARASFAPEERARMAATTSLCFDPSILELFVPLCTGGLVILKDNALDRFTPDERPTMLNGPPSVLGELAHAGAIPDSVRVINVGGEPLTAALVRTLYAKSRAARVCNHYGPTEATTLSAVAEVPRTVEGDPTLGTAIAGTTIHILDARGLPVPTGVEGEIHIGGAGLAIGYLGNPALTAERFVADPFTPGGRLYRTGDLGRWTEAREIAFLGRADTLVKLRGFRIELGEVEAALARIPGVRQAAANVVRDATGRDRLVAYLAGGGNPGLPALQRRLGASLPNYMVPSALVTLDALPLLPTGKIDRAALPVPEPEADMPAPEAHGISPVEETILNAFRRALDRPDIGLDDEFFASGGDSLLAIELALEIEQLLGQTVPVALLGHDASPRGLAAVLDDRPVELPDPFVTLQAKGAEGPLFCLHELYGRALSHISLARRLAPHMPVHGLLPGPIRDAIIAHPDMDALVAAHIATIRSIRPKGPYLISGFSFCGPFAHEIACALEAEGEQVLLIVIDSPIFTRWPRWRFVAQWLRREARVAGGLGETWQAIRASRTIWMRWFWPRLPIGAREVPGFVPRCDHAIARAIMQARVGWLPRRFGGRTVLVRSGVRPPTAAFVDEDGMLGWRDALAGPVETLTIEGPHNDMMREPLVADVADAIRVAAARLKTA